MWLFSAVVASLSSLVVVIVLVVAATAGGGLLLSLLLLVVVVWRQLNPVTATGFDGSSVVVGSFWCSGVGIGSSMFHIEVSVVSGNLYRSLGSLRWLI